MLYSMQVGTAQFPGGHGDPTSFEASRPPRNELVHQAEYL